MRVVVVVALFAAAPALADPPDELDTWLDVADEVGLFRAAQMHDAAPKPPETRARAAEVRRAPPPPDRRVLDLPDDGDDADAQEAGATPSPEALDATDGDDVDRIGPDR